MIRSRKKHASVCIYNVGMKYQTLDSSRSNCELCGEKEANEEDSKNTNW